MGSGHILVYAFDIFLQFYVAEGFRERDAAELILINNLYGLDIDRRAFQLAYFALMMKGRQYSRRFLAKNIIPNLYTVPDSTGLSEAELQLFHMNFKDLNKAHEDLLKLVEGFKNGKDLGSLIQFENIDFGNLKSGIQQGEISFLDQAIHEMICAGELLQQKYSIAVTNPPYMGSSGMDKALSNFVKKVYPDSKSDLFGVFMERLNTMTAPDGYYAMITQHAWMFLSSFENLRKKINCQTIINMAHLGTRAFEEIGGEVVQTTAFVISSTQHLKYVGSYLRLVDFANHELKETKSLEAIELGNVDYLYLTVQDNFAKIPGQPISYWVSENIVNLFSKSKKIGDFGISRNGLQPKETDRFVRQWYEVIYTNINFSIKTITETNSVSQKWFPYNKGGSKRKWSGNYDYIINWKNNGEDIRSIKKMGNLTRLSQVKNFTFTSP